MFFRSGEKSDIKIVRTMESKELGIISELEFTILGDTHKIDDGSESLRELTFDFWWNLTELLKSVDIQGDKLVFGCNTNVHVDMFVKYEKQSNRSGKIYEEYKKENESILMKFLISCLDMGLVRKENIVSREVTKMYEKGVGGVFVRIKRL